MLVESKGGLSINRKKGYSLFLLGSVLGLALAAGLLFGVLKQSPETAERVLSHFKGQQESEGQSQSMLQDFITNTVQDILTSPQGKAVVSDLLKSESLGTFQKFFIESMESQEFRKALGEALEKFLKSPEGKELLRKIATDALGG